MSNSKLPERPPRVLFLGMQCDFSYPALHALLESGIEVCAVVIPGSPGQGREKPYPYISHSEHIEVPARSTRPVLPVLHSSLHPDILQLAWGRQIPVREVQHLADPEAISRLAAYQPDVICVACYSQRIPPVILNIPRLGCLNVHPSLLPANRGLVPLFWTFREGCEQTGVTIHFMDEGMDTGDILAQALVDVPDGINYARLESQCAARGGELLARTTWSLYNGLAVRVPQDEAKSSYHSFPSTEDFAVPVAEWSARHVYNFICGVADWGDPIKLDVGAEHFLVQGAISYSHKDMGAAETYYREGETLRIRCKLGWVRVRLADFQ